MEIVTVFGNADGETCILRKTGDVFFCGAVVYNDFKAFCGRGSFQCFFGHQYRLWAGKSTCVYDLFVCHIIQLLCSDWKGYRLCVLFSFCDVQGSNHQHDCQTDEDSNLACDGWTACAFSTCSSSGKTDKPSASTGKTETTTKPDGTTVKTETRADGTKIQTVTGKDGSTATVKTDKNGKTEAKTKLSDKAIEDAKKNGEAVKAPVEVEATRNSSTAPTVSIELPKGAGETKVEIPVSNVNSGTVAVLVHPDGTEEIVKNSLPTENGVQLTVNGGATVKIVDHSKDFADTQNHWAKDAIDFVSARGLVSGMSETTYAPDNATTRAQLWTILARQNDADLTGGGSWYEKAQTWAKAKGISDGTAPEGTINRAQMVTMLYRAAGSPAVEGASAFTDISADSYYAKAAAWAAKIGITAGVGNGRFEPNGTCTRGQIATFLYRYMK